MAIMPPFFPPDPPLLAGHPRGRPHHRRRPRRHGLAYAKQLLLARGCRIDSYTVEATDRGYTTTSKWWSPLSSLDGTDVTVLDGRFASSRA